MDLGRQSANEIKISTTVQKEKRKKEKKYDRASLTSIL